MPPPLKYGDILHFTLFDSGGGEDEVLGSKDSPFQSTLGLLSFSHSLGEGPDREAILSAHDLPVCVKLSAGFAVADRDPSSLPRDPYESAVEVKKNEKDVVITENSPLVLETLDGVTFLGLQPFEDSSLKKNKTKYLARWKEAADHRKEVWCLRQRTGTGCNGGSLQYGIPTELIAVQSNGELLTTHLVHGKDGVLEIAVNSVASSVSGGILLIAEPLEEVPEAGLPLEEEEDEEEVETVENGVVGVAEGQQQPPSNEEHKNGNISEDLSTFDGATILSTPEEDVEHTGRALFVVPGEGPLGATLKRDEEGAIQISSVSPGGQAYAAGLLEGDNLEEVGGWVVPEQGVSKEAWPHLLEYIKHAERPLTIVISRTSTTLSDGDGDCPVEPQVVKGLGNREGETVENSSRKKSIDRNGDDDGGDVKVANVLQALARIEFSAPTATKDRSVKFKSARDLADGKRDVLKRGTLNTLRVGALWSTYADIEVVLLTDLLVIANRTRKNPKPVCEACLTLSAAKLKVFGESPASPFSSIEGKQLSSRLEVISPAGSFVFCFASARERDEWASALARQILYLMDSNSESVSVEESPRSISDSVRGAVAMHHIVTGTLHSAALMGDSGVVSSLLTAGAEPDEKDSEGLSALEYAVRAGQVGSVEVLLAAGATCNNVDKKGRTLLHIAASALEEATLRVLLGSPSLAPLVNSRDADGFTPAHSAASAACRSAAFSSLTTSRLDACIFMLRRGGADLDLPAADGLSALHRSAMLWRSRVVESLCSCGADPNGALPDTSPLHLACSGSHFSSSPFARKGDSSFSLRSLSRREKCFGSSSDLDREQSPPIRHRPNLPATVEVLLRWGAYPNLPDGAGTAPLEYIMAPWILEGKAPGSQDELIAGMPTHSKSTACFDASESESSRLAAAVILMRYGGRTQENVLSAAGSVLGTPSISAFESAWAERATQQELTHADVVVRRVWNEADWIDAPRCALCLLPFTMFRRQHHCRFCGKAACSPCSQKTVTLSGGNKQHRACDSCFNRLRTLSEMLAQGISPRLPHWDDNSLVEEERGRKKLFAGSVTGGTSAAAASAAPTGRTSGGLSGLHRSLQGAQSGLMDRGEALSNVAEKTDALAESAALFEKAARELSNQRRGWF